ncbi:MAG: WXG100 family type VII secretion target [Bacteroidota bacterium]
MSKKVKGDPDAIRDFANYLKAYNAELANGLGQTRGKLKQLGQSWQDQEYDKFESSFGQMIRNLPKLIQEIEAHQRYLIKKAQALENYLNQGG